MDPGMPILLAFRNAARVTPLAAFAELVTGKSDVRLESAGPRMDPGMPILLAFRNAARVTPLAAFAELATGVRCSA
jgi:hypothetical protein